MPTKEKVIISAEDRTKKAFDSVTNGLSGVTAKVGGLAAALTGVAGVAGFGALIKSQLDAQDALAKSADKIGANITQLAGLRYAAEQTSGSYQGIDEALTKASKRLGEFNANGGGAANKWLEKLNLDTERLATLDPTELFAEYADAINTLDTRGEKLAATSALMGDESRKFLTLIEGGSGAIEDFTAEAELMGIAISDVDAKQIEAANDAINRASKSVTGLATQFAVELAPYIKATADLMFDAGIKGEQMSRVVTTSMNAIISAIGLVADAWRGWELIISAVSSAAITEFAAMANGFVWLDQAISDLISKIPGLEVKPSEGLKKFAEEAGLAAQGASEKFQELATKALPSTTFREFSLSVQEEAEKIAAATVEARRKINELSETAPRAESSVGGSFYSKELEGVDNFLMSKEEKERAHVDRLKTDVWQAYYQNSITTKEEAEQKLSEIDAVFAEQRKAAKARERHQQLSAAASFMGQLSDVSAAFGEKGAKAAKAAAIAETTIRTYQSATAAYAALAGVPIAGPALGAAAAATAIAAGLQNVAMIKATNYAGAYDKGGNIPAGQFGLVGEYGPELISGPVNVTSREETAKLLKAPQANAAPKITMNVNIDSPDPNASARIILQNESLIVNMMRSAFREAGVNAGI